MRRAATLALVLFGLFLAGTVQAQSSREAERRLQRVKRELSTVAAERRSLEGQRGDASRQLRQADEQVGRTSRVLRDTEVAMTREQRALAALQQRRDALQSALGGKRAELARLLRAAYTLGDDAPLKVLLSQDRVADAQRALTYHRYLQRDRVGRIQSLTAELREVDALEQRIADKRTALETTQRAQREQLAQLEQARRERAGLVARLDQRYQDRASREQALGRDARALQQLLMQLRTAAAKAAAQRRAAVARPPKPAKGSRPGTVASTPLRKAVASAPALQVGGLGWPLAGSLLAGYGGSLPDGRKSEGVLIGAAAGSTVKAVADGRVVFSDWMNGYGLILIVDHGNGYMSLYAHNDALLRDAGDVVKRGDAVASVGNSGGQGRPALYFELRRNGQPVNPNSWLQKR
jgi:septal ring factor EnvC (AmiA/AmiB activator)